MTPQPNGAGPRPGGPGGPEGALEGAGAAGAEGRRRRLIVLAVCSTSLFIVSLDNTIVNVALPTLQHRFGSSVSGLQWVVDAYLLVLASLLLLSGSAGDRFGRRRIFWLGLTLFGTGSLLCSLAWSLPALIAFRIFQAVGGSMLNPSSLSIIANTFTDPRERAGAIGVWAGVSGISTASGPILGGLLIQAVDWRAVFWVNLPVVVVAGLLTRRFVPESRAARPRRFDPPGQLLAIAVLGLAVFAIIEGPADGWSSPTVLGCFGASVLALVVFLIVEQRRAEPLLELRFFRSPPFSGAATIAVAAFVVLAGFLFVMTLYLQEVRGDSPLVAGLATLPMTLAIAVVSPWSGRLVGRSGARLPMVASGLLLALGSALLLLDTPRSSYLLLAAAYLPLGIGFGLVNPPITNTAVSGMPPGQAGVASAVAGAARQIGAALGVAVVGSVVTSRMLSLLEAGSGTARARPGAGLSILGSGGAMPRHLGAVFTEATHAGWLVCLACGLLIAAVGATTTGPWALRHARAAVGDLGAPDPGRGVPSVEGPA
jgi:EmrB/QacA subfamily drug resistance transporter